MLRISIIILSTIFLMLFCSCEQSTSNYLEYEVEQGNQTINIDLDGDGIKETISLAKNEKGLNLKVNNKQLFVPFESIIENTDMKPFYEIPKLYIWNEEGSKLKSLMISLVWNTNKIGTKAELWLFNYSNNQIKEIFTTSKSNEEVNYSLSNYKDGYVDINIPRFSFTKRISVDNEYYEDYLSLHLIGELDIIANVMYYLNDLDEDGYPEIIIEKAVSTGAIEWLPFTSIFEISQVERGVLTPIIYVPNSRINQVKSGILHEIISNGFILKSNEFNDEINSLIQENILQEKKGKVYLKITK